MAVRTENEIALEANEIDQLNQLNQDYNNNTFKRGQISLAEENLENQKQELKLERQHLMNREQELSKALFEKYGKGEIDLDKGTIKIT